MTYCWQCEADHEPPVAEEDEACPDFESAIETLSRLAWEELGASMVRTLSDTHPQLDPEP